MENWRGGFRELRREVGVNEIFVKDCGTDSEGARELQNVCWVTSLAYLKLKIMNLKVRPEFFLAKSSFQLVLWMGHGISVGQVGQ